jgi:hypothetical protein
MPSSRFFQVDDPRPVRVQLRLEQAELLRQRHGQQGLGPGDGGVGAGELRRVGESRQPSLRRLRPVELVGVQEALPLASPGRDERLRVGEGDDEAPGRLADPVVEGVQGGRVVLAERGPELVDQRGALGDQLELVAAEQAQLGRQRVLREQRPPAVAVGAQGVGEAPGVQRVVLGAGRALRSR